MGIESLLVVTKVSHIALDLSNEFIDNSSTRQKVTRQKLTKRNFPHHFNISAILNFEQHSFVSTFNAIYPYIYPFVYIFDFSFFSASNFSKLRIINHTCSNCTGSVFMERTCVNQNNCTGQNNITSAFNEKEKIKRQCSITENQQKGGCVPGSSEFI